MERRREVVDRRHSSLSIVRQCRLLDISRSGLYYQPVGVSQEDMTLMKLIDRQYLVTPFYGARKIAAWLKSQGQRVNRKRIRRLMLVIGLKAIYRRPSSPVRPLPGSCSSTESGSVWMGKEATTTTCSSSACGGQ